VAGQVEIEWSSDALADLDRFAAFLHERFPDLAARVGREIIARADILARHPKLGRPMAGREEYREIVLQISEGDSLRTTEDSRLYFCAGMAGGIALACKPGGQ
jgi:plasmid stabilization system protein ParE